MNGVHDMGGMHGFGPVDPYAADSWHSDWEGRVFALTLAASGILHGSIDRRRFELETLPPADYLQGYFQRWYTRLVNAGVASGIIGEAERAAIEGGESVAATRDHEPLSADVLLGLFESGAPSRREIASEPAFARGDAVRARNINPPTHTRLPRYVRGRAGTVVAHRGAHVFPDSNAERKGEDPRHLYAVRFAAKTLWGPEAPAGDSVTLDLWEPYLEAPG
ncbi:MAG: nitrile hydratase subunit beta [Gammaproteobacteria bacterium]|nr:nitrile hydratase subunit beta [Gammaproteobacteria bacterium]MDE0367554.1 nitrile hydratase subunit beta [Gammaproteobacteria bacterium]